MLAHLPRCLHILSPTVYVYIIIYLPLYYTSPGIYIMNSLVAIIHITLQLVQIYKQPGRRAHAQWASRQNLYTSRADSRNSLNLRWNRHGTEGEGHALLSVKGRNAIDRGEGEGLESRL